MTITNKTFIITGGASGLGLATALMIIERGGSVVLADINENAGKAAKKTLGKKALFIQSDITDEVQAQQVVDAALEAFGLIHGLINCAGIAPAERVAGRSGPHHLNTFTKVIQVNLIGSFNILRLVAASMINNPPEESGERGILINTASVAAFDGQIGQAAYSASKGGIVAMTLPIARELARFGIRVMAIAPGIFETPMLMDMPDEVKASLGQQVPFPSRLGKPEEYAALVTHIIENPMLNGEVIRLDGAIRMAPK